jgi:hypothetical protein
MFTVTRHGAPFVLQAGSSNRGTTGKKEAQQIANSVKEVKNVYGITLVSCFGANGGPFSNAQMVANSTGKPVRGYYGRTTEQGICSHSRKESPSKVFRPQEPQTAAICEMSNQVLGHVVMGAIVSVRAVSQAIHPGDSTPELIRYSPDPRFDTPNWSD